MNHGIVVDVARIQIVFVLDEVVQEVEVAIPNRAHGGAPVVESSELIDKAGVVLVELDDFVGLFLL